MYRLLRTLSLGFLALLILSHGRASGAIPANYYNSADASSPAALRASLHTIIANGSIKIGYDNTWEPLKATDLTTAGNVRLMYTGQSRSASAQCSQDCQDGDPLAGTWSREHIFPQSTFDEEEPERSDLHALFPCDQDVNNARSNKPYNTVTDPTYTASGSKGDDDFWEVRPEDRGDVARAVFYMDVRYEGSPTLDLVLSDNPSPTRGAGQMGILSTLLLWHQDDPPDDWERLRNGRVYDVQKNSNPFVDHPEWVGVIYGTSQQTTNGNTLAVASRNIAPATFIAGGQARMLELSLTANADEWDIASVAVNKLGTLADAQIEALLMYSDEDRSGTVTPDDSLVGSGTFIGGVATLNTKNFRVTNATEVFLLVVQTFPTAPNNATVQLRINSGAIVHSSTGGADPDPTFATINSGTSSVTTTGATGGVIISEIMFDPHESETVPTAEWVEILNARNSVAELINYHLEDSVNSTNTFSVRLAPFESAVVFPVATGIDGFQAAWGGDFKAIPVGNWILLNNVTGTDSERVSLHTPSLELDVVSYQKTAPWPTGTLNGPSFYLISGKLNATDNDNGANWKKSVAGTDGAHASLITTVFDGSDIGSPGFVQGAVAPVTPGDVNGDGFISPTDADAAFECYLFGACAPGYSDTAADLCPATPDGKVTPNDAAGIFRKFLGITPNCAP